MGCGSAPQRNAGSSSPHRATPSVGRSGGRHHPRSGHARRHRHRRPHRHRHIRRHAAGAEIVVSHCRYRTGSGCPRIPPPGSCRVRNGLEDRRCTPGAVSPAVRQATIFRTICRPGGYTDSVRPPQSYTEPLKYRLMAAYGYRGRSAGHFELDHLIPLELGGAPADPRNLWPEPLGSRRNALQKDTVENRLRNEVCSREIKLALAQRQSLRWIAAYHGAPGSRRISRPGGKSSAGLGGPGSNSTSDKDCADFSTQAQAERFFRAHNGSRSRNYDGLDGDHDGRACESLP